MLDYLYTFLISISPFGEARVGIPYGILKKLPVINVFFVGWLANLMVFPLFYKGISVTNTLLWQKKWYKKSAVYLSRRAKHKTQTSIKKYGILGLLIFVMIPLPITGAYIGTLASYILRMDYKKSMLAISIGVTISCLIIAFGMHVGTKAF